MTMSSRIDSIIVKRSKYLKIGLNIVASLVPLFTVLRITRNEGKQGPFSNIKKFILFAKQIYMVTKGPSFP